MKTNGFTLVETMIVTLIAVVIGAAVLTSLMVGRTTFIFSDASALVQQEARRAFDNTVRELRESATMSCGEAATTASCTNDRVNFQIVRGYDAATQTLQLGSEASNGEFVHYIITGAGTNAQLVRCRSAAATTATASFGDFSGCRVLANYVNGGPSTFSWDSPGNVVTVTLEVEYRHPILPTGSRRTGVLTSRVRVRNVAS